MNGVKRELNGWRVGKGIDGGKPLTFERIGGFVRN
jgi:hypothetical protein